MRLQSQKSPNRKPNVIALGLFFPVLALFDARKLLQSPTVNFNIPRPQSVIIDLVAGNIQVAGRPVFLVAVSCNFPEYFDKIIIFQADLTPIFGNVDIGNRLIAFSVGIDLAVAFQLAQPVPFHVAQPLQI